MAIAGGSALDSRDMSRIDVLDKGYVRVTHVGGDDLAVVNAARVSFDRESTEFGDSDKRLLKYLAQHGHTSPFRHVSIGLEIYAPLMVARQWWKHVVGAPFVDTPWNESSRRYVTETPEFYIPEDFKSAPESAKQGAGGRLPGSELWKDALWQHQRASERLYEDAIEAGMAVEQARLFLPAYGLYVRWRWVPTLQAAEHFVKLRDHGDAQGEIQQYSKAVNALCASFFPQSWEALRGKK